MQQSNKYRKGITLFKANILLRFPVAAKSRNRGIVASRSGNQEATARNMKSIKKLGEMYTKANMKFFESCSEQMKKNLNECCGTASRACGSGAESCGS